LTDDIRTALAAVHKRIVMAASDIADGPVISNLRTVAGVERVTLSPLVPA